MAKRYKDPPVVARQAKRVDALPPGKAKRMGEQKVAVMRREYRDKTDGIRKIERGDT